MIPPWVFLAPWVVLAILAAALVLVVLAWRGRMEVERGRCSACGHALHDPLPARCVECGTDLARRDAIVWGRPVVRRRMFGAGAGLVGLAAIVFVAPIVWSMTTGRAGRPGGGPPTASVTAMSPAELGRALDDGLHNALAAGSTASDPDALDAKWWGGLQQESVVLGSKAEVLWSEVLDAIELGTLSAQQVQAVAEAAARHTRACLERSGTCSAAPMEALSRIARGGIMDEQAMGSLFRSLMDDLEILGPSEVRAGEEVFLVPSATLAMIHARDPDASFALRIGGASLDGRPLPLATPVGATRVVRFGGGPTSELRSIVPLATVLNRVGPAEIEVDLVLAIRPGRQVQWGGPVGGGGTAPGDSALNNPTSNPGTAGSPPEPGLQPGLQEVPLARLVHRVEVLPEDASLPRPADDPALAAKVKEALRFHVEWGLDIDGRTPVVLVVAQAEPLAECAMSFDLSLLASGEGIGECSIGRLDVPQRAFLLLDQAEFGQPAGPEFRAFSGWAPEWLGDREAVTLRLTPRPPDARRAPRGDRWCDVPVIIEDVPVRKVFRGGTPGDREPRDDAGRGDPVP